MKFSHSFTAILGLCSGVRGALDLLDESNLFVPSWEVEVHPGGPKAVLNGTVEQVYAELLQMNPAWDKDFARLPVEGPALEKRTSFRDGSLICGRPFEPASIKAIRNGISYLRQVKGRPSMPADPSKCGRSDKPKTLLSFGSIADGAQFVIDECSHAGDDFVAGSAHHPTQWNVRVDKDEKNC
ncbi:hypothetical protein CDD83_7595 [Cordyceps sp. RAO-2017]|nr:hypothetical protein CDD83_7595 [Cordyceps sp. RAO-2017]